MKTKLTISICIVLGGLWFYNALHAIRSATFSGPEFHSRNTNDNIAVHSALSHHLNGLGFAPSASPSEGDSWAGIHSEGAERLWFVKKASRDQKTYIYIDLSKLAVRTSVKWWVNGTKYEAQMAERNAYSLASNLSNWFENRKESNNLPKEQRDLKRQYYQNHLVEKI